jgi:hypothetical protein
MEEKNLVVLPEEVVEYLDFMKEKNYTLKGALNVVIGKGETKKFVDNYLEYGENQEKFALAWLNGYKQEEKIFVVEFKGFSNIYCYLNYAREEKIFSLSSVDESACFKTHFTKTFLEENGFGWVFNSEGVNIIEVEND